MVWGAISTSGTSRLAIIDGTMDQKKYINVLESHLLPQLQEWFGENEFLYQQDRAPCHTARSVNRWFAKKGLRILPWPGNSPDMNPIETLWDVLKNEIHEVPITNKTQLIDRLNHVWLHSGKIRNLCSKLINGMPKRVKDMFVAKGGPTKY